MENRTFVSNNGVYDLALDDDSVEDETTVDIDYVLIPLNGTPSKTMSCIIPRLYPLRSILSPCTNHFYMRLMPLYRICESDDTILNIINSACQLSDG